MCFFGFTIVFLTWYYWMSYSIVLAVLIYSLVLRLRSIFWVYYYWGILMIFHRNESISCLYLIWLSVLIIHDVTLALVIMSELHHFTSWFNLVVCLWILHVMSWFNPVMFYNHIIILFVMYKLVWLTVHIIICFCHAQLCMNDYAYYYSALSCTNLYEWLFYS